MEKQTAFGRALGFLSFKPAARWLALAACIGSGVLSLALLLVLGLCADLVVYQGKVPTADPEAVYQLLVERAGSEAANHYREALAAGRDQLGILSLVVRSRDQFHGPLVGGLAARNPWMWRTSEADPSSITYLTGLAGIALGLALLRSLLTFAGHAFAAAATVEAASRMRRAVYHHTYRLGTLAIRSLGPSEAVSMFTRHIEAIGDALFAWLTITVVAPIAVLLLLGFAFLVNFWLTLIALIGAGLAWLIGGQLASSYHFREDKANRRIADQLALLQESLMLMRLVKVYLMEIVNQARVEHQLGSYGRWQRRRAVLDGAYRALLGFFVLLGCMLLLFVAGLSVLDGQLSVPAGIVLVGTLFAMYGPARSWIDHWKVLQRGRESAITLFKFLDRTGEVGQVVGAEVLPPMSKRLEFDNVTIREPGSNRVLLQDISFAIPAGARVALVGPEDLEKQALVYLIPRFLDPTSGEIRIDDHNLRWVSLDSLRKQIALVLQHNLVFNDTVSSNIRCGDTSIKQPRVVEAAKLAHAHQFIQKLPRGYDTPIGDMGHSLTVGEQFRIALARAIVRNPALLIVEEPPAFHLDEDTQDLLDDTLNRVLPGRTMIFLPHRKATLERCNRVFLISKGRLEAHGEHEDLLKQNDLYRHLHYTEFNEFAGQL